MAELAVDLLQKLNKIFEEYKEIDTDVVSSSIKHPLPVPVLYKRIKFQQHADNLKKLSTELSNILCEIETLQSHTDNSEANRGFLETLKEYSFHLKTTIDKLFVICNQCSLDAEFESMFKWKKYKSDVSAYKKSVKELEKLRKKLEFS